MARDDETSDTIRSPKDLTLGREPRRPARDDGERESGDTCRERQQAVVVGRGASEVQSGPGKRCWPHPCRPPQAGHLSPPPQDSICACTIESSVHPWPVGWMQSPEWNELPTGRPPSSSFPFLPICSPVSPAERSCGPVCLSSLSPSVSRSTGPCRYAGGLLHYDYTKGLLTSSCVDVLLQWTQGEAWLPRRVGTDVRPSRPGCPRRRQAPP